MSNLQPLVSFQNVSFLDSVDIRNINGTLFRFIFTHSLTLAGKAFQCLIQYSRPPSSTVSFSAVCYLQSTVVQSVKWKIPEIICFDFPSILSNVVEPALSCQGWESFLWPAYLHSRLLLPDNHWVAVPVVRSTITVSQCSYSSNPHGTS